MKNKVKIELLKTTIIAVLLGLAGIILLIVGCSDLIHIINLKFFNRDSYTRLSNRYAEITVQSMYNTQYIIGIILMTILGVLLTLYFIWYLKVAFFDGINIRKKNL